MRQLPNGLDGIIFQGIDHSIRTQLLRSRQTLLADIQGDDARSHRMRQLRRRKPYRSLPKNRNSLIAF